MDRDGDLVVPVLRRHDLLDSYGVMILAAAGAALDPPLLVLYLIAAATATVGTDLHEAGAEGLDEFLRCAGLPKETALGARAAAAVWGDAVIGDVRLGANEGRRGRGGGG